MDPIASLFLFLAFLAPVKSPATTFGPIKLVDQVHNAQYFVHGRIVGNGSAAKERTLQVPYTYWKLAVIDQPLGGGLTGEIDIREPGGEVGELGYHVAGTATFRDGEEVYVALRDTDEGRVKEVVGLASGKYTVEGDTVRSGLGPVIRGPTGAPLSVEEFSRVIRRTASGRQTEQDKNIFVNRGPGHGAEEEHPHLPATTTASVSNRRKPAETPVSQRETLTATTDSAVNSVKNNPGEPEKPSTGTSGSWWFVVSGAVALALAAIFLLRR